MRWPSLALVALLAAGCGGSGDGELSVDLAAVEPQCATNSQSTPVELRGSMPVQVALPLSSGDGGTVDTSYRVWLGEVELVDVQWVNAQTVRATVPSGLPPGDYPIVIESPFGARSDSGASFRVSEGTCDVPSGPGLTIAADARPAAVDAGGQVAVSATITNGGLQTVLGVRATATPPPGFEEFTSPADPQDIPANGSRTFTWTFTAAAGAGRGTFAIDASGTDALSNQTVVATQARTNEVAVQYPVAVAVSGLAGSGLVLQLAGATGAELEALPVSGNGTTEFVRHVASGDRYFVAVKTQPSNPAQTCVVSGGGSAASPNQMGTGRPVIQVNCSTQSATVGGTVSGLAGSGLVLRLNGVTDLPITGNGTYAFPPVTTGTAYNVTVQSQPSSPAQTCSVANPTGTVTAGGVTNVNVTCSTSSFPVSGTIVGLSGTGLVLRLNGTLGPTATISGSSFTFAAQPSGTAYNVTVATQPSNPSQTCTVTNGAGTITTSAVTNVVVTCTTSSFSVSGTITGLAGSGLQLTLGGQTLSPAAGATSFTFPTPLPLGASYSVAVTAQPTGPTQTCSVTNGSGTISGPVTNVIVNCTTSSFTVGGTIANLQGSGLRIQLGSQRFDADPLDTSYVFGTPLASGASYTVSITRQPSSPTQTCSFAGGATTVSGTVGSQAVSLPITCTTAQFTVGGSVTGLAAGNTITLTEAATNTSRTITANGSYSAFSVPSGTSYQVTVSDPSSPVAQDCSVSGATGQVQNQNVTNVNVTCSTLTFSVGGTISGLEGTGLQLSLGGQTVNPGPGATAFTFPTELASGTSYTVSVTGQPSSPTQVCSVASNANGTVGAANVTNVVVSCVTSSFTVGGNVSGTTSSGLALRLTSASIPARDATPPGNGPYTFGEVPSGTSYTIEIQAAPPGQMCDFATPNSTGTVGGAEVGNIDVVCSDLVI